MALRISIVVSSFNEDLTNALLLSAKETLLENGCAIEEIVSVPGSFEIPYACKLLALKTNPVDAIVALGAILRGETDQNTHLAHTCIDSVQKIQLETMIPIGLGIISAQTLQQAWERTRGELNRGREAALAAIAMAHFKKSNQLSVISNQ